MQKGKVSYFHRRLVKLLSATGPEALIVRDIFFLSGLKESQPLDRPSAVGVALDSVGVVAEVESCQSM